MKKALTNSFTVYGCHIHQQIKLVWTTGVCMSLVLACERVKANWWDEALFWKVNVLFPLRRVKLGVRDSHVIFVIGDWQGTDARVWASVYKCAFSTKSAWTEFVFSLVKSPPASGSAALLSRGEFLASSRSIFIKRDHVPRSWLAELSTQQLFIRSLNRS